MILLRAIFRTGLVFLLTGYGFAMTLIGKAVGWLSPTTGLRLRNHGFRMWARGLCRAWGVRVRIEGPRPQGAFFLVSNHVSYLDIPLIASAIDTAFVAKADLGSWPLLGTVFRSADTIFIDRGRKRDLLRVRTEMEQALERQLGVVLFPEGTSGRGDQLLPFKPSLLQFAAEQGFPVHYATLSYRAPEGQLPAQRSICWWGDEALLPHYKRFIRLPYLEAVLTFGDQPVEAADRKELALHLRSAMEQTFRPMD